ncbi:uncharacterized protein LOC110882051 [Helianthus annuus]|uniref:uncharacterized protein LOC110882051 n=1 Tax=Helianthus annuus TaxID=4232 RepID=UPI000B8F1DC8|nr:uncharacterized protein LOC110882051 [Helianthus annuus]
MADKVLMAKELEVDSKTASESISKVSKSGSNNESGKTDKAKIESDCKNCMKDCKVCSTNAYLTAKKTEELVEKVKMVEDQILSRDKLMRASNERIKELTERIERDKTDLKRTIKDSDERNGKTSKENFQLSGVLQTKERQINQHLDEIANLKLQFQEAKIENKRINLKLNSYSSASFVLQHIVPQPIGKNQAGEDVYSDGTGKKSGLDNEDETNEKLNDVKLPETNDVTFTSSSDEDSDQFEVVKNVVENVLKSDSDSTEDERCFLNNYIPKSKSQNNLSDKPTLVMYKMSGSDKLYSDSEFPLENVNVDKLKKVFKLELPRSISRWIMDSGASRHMTGRKALLYDVIGFNGGYVGFASNQGGRIIGEGTLSNGVITFEGVNYIAELENNLLSISQICDRMYSTHFTNKECLILNPGFVIP